MNELSSSIDPSVRELAAGCSLAHAMVSAAQNLRDSKALLLLKNHLVRTHRRHLDQLREHGLQSRVKSEPRGVLWSDLALALRSPSDDVVVGACNLLERALLAAYERALARPSIDAELRRLLHRQHQELKCCYEYYVCRLSAWRQGNRPPRQPAQPTSPALATAA